MGYIFRSFLACAALLFLVAAAEAQTRRVALLVGNGNYANATQLGNPKNDTRIIAEALKRTGFTVVDIKTDAGVDAMRRALRDFRKAAEGAQVALVYFSGHGIEANGKNWLIPVDAELSSEGDLSYEAVELDLVLQAVHGAEVRIVMLDACRNNPFGKSWSSGTRMVSRGLARVIDVDDVVVIYAAAPGQVALDGAGAASPFATSVAKRLPQQGLALQLLGGVVRDDVVQMTKGAQRPFVSASITGTPFYLAGGGSLTDAERKDLERLRAAERRGLLVTNVDALSTAPDVISSPAVRTTSDNPAPETRQFVEAFQQAVAAFNSEDWDTVLIHANEAALRAKSDTGRSSAAQLRLFAHHSLGQKAKALTDVEYLLGMQGLSAELVQNYRAVQMGLYDELGDRTKAVELVRSYIADYGGSGTNLAFIARRELDMKNYVEAAGFARDAIDQAKREGSKPKQQWYNILLNAYAGSGDIRAYHATLQIAAAAYPDNEQYQQLLDEVK